MTYTANKQEREVLCEELAYAIRHSNDEHRFAKAVEGYTAAGLSLNDPIHNGKPALHCATKSDHVIKHGAGASLGWVNADWERFDRLLGAGADINAPDRLLGATALMHALYWDEQGMALAGRLLEAGADPNRVDHDGRSALHAAAGRGVPEAVRVLIGAGADLRLRDIEGNEPVGVALIRGRWHNAEVLLDAGVPINAKAVYADDTGTLLHAAARQRLELGCARLLLEHGADPSAVSERGRTALMWAVGRRYIEDDQMQTVGDLLKADPDGSVLIKTDNEGMNALHHAVLTPPSAPSNRCEYVTRLLAHASVLGPDDKKLLLDARRKAGRFTPLHMVICEGNTDLALLLLAAGADVNACDDEGNTPLDWAHKHGHFHAVELLEQMGGSVSVGKPGAVATPGTPALEAGPTP